MKQLDITPTKSNRISNAIQFNDADSSYQIGLTFSVELSLAVPPGAKIVRFVPAGGTTIWISTVSGISIPSGGNIVSALNNAEPNPAQRVLTREDTTLYFFSLNNTAKLGVYFYNG